VLALVLTGGAWAAMQVLIVVAAAGYITAYVLVCIAAPVFLWRIGELTLWPLLRAVVAGVLLSVALVVYLVVESAGERAVGVWVFLVTMALGIAIWAIRHRRRPWLSSTVGVYDETVSADVLGGPSAEPR
jgi:amino acid transporter